MDANSLKMVLGPLMSMVEGMVPKEAPNNDGALFVQELVDTFMPATQDEMLLKVKGIISNIAVVAINKDPESFDIKLIELKAKLDTYLEG